MSGWPAISELLGPGAARIARAWSCGWPAISELLGLAERAR